MEKSRIEGLLGLCKRAGRMTVGTDLTVKAIREGKGAKLVLIAGNASDNSKKRVTDCCLGHKTPYREIVLDTEALGHIVGKGSAVAAVGINDGGFAEAILKEIEG